MRRCIYNYRHLSPAIILLTLFWVVSLKTSAQEEILSDTITKAFYDTLKVRAERNRLTRALYDMVVTNPSGKSSLKQSLGSTMPFIQYEGMRIRKCETASLNAFGSDIDDPLKPDPSGIDKLLNSSYVKTKRSILRNYLLFKAGDTVSSLQMSDNERLIRELPYINDARITIVPVDSNNVDVLVLVRESYPIGVDLKMEDFTSGKATFFDKNVGGYGHELDITVPFKFDLYSYPGIGVKYVMKNLAHSFSNIELDISDGLGITSTGGSFKREFVSSETKYAWSASIRVMNTTEDLDTMSVAVPLHYTYQDVWAARAFMIDRPSVTRLIFSGRYVNNNVYRKPEIDEFSFYRLQKYQLTIGSIALSSQKYINTSLIYSYGRTEDIPYGYLVEAVAGRERNEYKWRTYMGVNAAYGNIFDGFGYIYAGFGFSTFYNHDHTEQGIIQSTVRYFTPLMHYGRSRIRTFLNFYYTRGFNRYTDEYLYFNRTTHIRGFSNDSIRGNRRFVASLEPVVFAPRTLYGFQFAFFVFADAGIITNGGINEGTFQGIAAYGLGIRIRNDRLVLNTIQIRFSIYPAAPQDSNTSWAYVNGIVKLRPQDFEPGPPAVLPY